jgi:ADP-heptose:LPS heptosyltransferase
VALIDRPRILVLRALGLGDFLTGVPALRALRRAFPGHELVLAAPAALSPLVPLARSADRLLPTHGLEPVDWSGPPPDLAVNLHGRGPQSHELLSRLRPGRLVAFGCVAGPAGGAASPRNSVSHRSSTPSRGTASPRGTAWFDGPGWQADEHEVHRWCRLLTEALDIPADPADLVLEPPPEPPAVPGAVVVHPGAAYPSRRWPAERFAEVARWVATRGHEVVVTGGPDEVDLAQEVRRSAGLPESAVLAGRTDLTQLAAVVASARLLVCGDTGVAHLASAYRTPSVVLFGPVAPSSWGPPPDGPHTVVWHGEGAGDPWGDRVDPALMRTTVDEVVAGADRLLATTGHPATGPAAP